MGTHTPGPWNTSGESIETLANGPSDVPFIHIEADGYEAGGGVAMVHNKHSGVGIANAKLVCSAPDMDLLLNAIRFGVVTVNPTPMVSFHFGKKIEYPHIAGWSGVVHGFGRDDLRTAIELRTRAIGTGEDMRVCTRCGFPALACRCGEK